MFSKSASKIFEDSSRARTTTINKFFDSVRTQNEEEIREFFNNLKYVPWSYKEDNDYTALHRATFMNSEKITELLIEEVKKRAGMEYKTILSRFMNEKTREGFTALHYAAYNGNIKIARTLIENGANVDLVNNRGKNVMHIAAESNQLSIMVFFMVFHGHDVFSLDEYGSTPLHWACYSGAEEAVLLLLSLKSSINAKDKEGLTPLHLAVLSNKYKIVLRLLQKGADKTMVNNKNETPLEIAIKKNYYKCITLLREQDFNPLCTLESPVEYKEPDNTYKYIIFGIIIIPEIILLLCILPYIDGNGNLIVNLFSFALSLASYILFFLKEPIYLHDQKLIDDSKGSYPFKTLIEKEVNIIGYCPTCFVLKNKDCRHCFICDKCIEGFSHHCFWMNRCIGKGNKYFYIMFLLLSLIYALSSFFFSVCVMMNHANYSENNFLVEFDFLKYNRNIIILATAFIIIFAFLFSMPLFCLILIQIIKPFGIFKKKYDDNQSLVKNDDYLINLVDKNAQETSQDRLIPEDETSIEINPERPTNIAIHYKINSSDDNRKEKNENQGKELISKESEREEDEEEKENEEDGNKNNEDGE